MSKKVSMHFNWDVFLSDSDTFLKEYTHVESRNVAITKIVDDIDDIDLLKIVYNYPEMADINPDESIEDSIYKVIRVNVRSQLDDDLDYYVAPFAGNYSGTADSREDKL